MRIEVLKTVPESWEAFANGATPQYRFPGWSEIAKTTRQQCAAVHEARLTTAMMFGIKLEALVGIPLPEVDDDDRRD